MLTVSELYIYPIKSLGGVAVSSAVIIETGFQYDRKWMLVDENNNFLTQREHASMALLQVELTAMGLKVFHKQTKDSIVIPYAPSTTEIVMVQIWSDRCKAQFVGMEADEWFTAILGFKCRLVYMPYTTKRRVDGRYASKKETTAFSDGYPFMMIGQSSLDDLNEKLAEPLPMNRFRPNIVFTGGKAFEEDIMEHIIINNINFYGVKLCARCVITTIDQDDASKAKEPLKTLAAYRSKNNNIYFGQNLLHLGEGAITIGDKISVLKKKTNKPGY